LPHLQSSTLFPYTTLFRSDAHHDDQGQHHGVFNRRRAVFTLQEIDRELSEPTHVLFPFGSLAIPSLEFGGNPWLCAPARTRGCLDRKSTRLNSSHLGISYA